MNSLNILKKDEGEWNLLPYINFYSLADLLVV